VDAPSTKIEGTSNLAIRGSFCLKARKYIHSKRKCIVGANR
jgi:hypothetical protein